MNFRFLTITLLLLISTGLFMSMVNDPKYPRGYFQLPVKRAVKLSGTFGELRPNHFHSGIDIKSANGTVGESLHAAAGGYISRIKVQAYSYGRAIYIAHPNGYTTVYAHLHEFSDELEKYVRKKQYQYEKFSVDLYPDPGDFPLEQGQYIGKLGNSGNSFGPHLHFEIRETATQVPVNPLLFDLEIDDSVRPDIYELVVYHLNDQHEVMDKSYYPVVSDGIGKYRLSKPLEIPAWRVAFGVKAYDRMNGVSNKNGVYALELNVDSSRAYQFQMNAIPFNMTRYINSHMDYAYKQNRGGYVNRCYKLPGNRLDIYGPSAENGIVKLFQDQERNVQIEVRDTDGNESILSFDIVRSGEMKTPERESYHYVIEHDKSFQLEHAGFKANFPSGTFYEKTYLRCDTEENSGSFLSDIYSIGSHDIPAHRSFDISIDASHLDMETRLKTFICQITKDGKLVNCGGKWNGNRLHTKVRGLGKYTLMEDRVSPRIVPISFQTNMAGRKSMSFQITDNMDTGGSARGLQFNATVNGKWILMEYDGKRDLLIHPFDDNIGPGEYQLKIVVEDDRGNVSVLEREFVR